MSRISAGVQGAVAVAWQGLWRKTAAQEFGPAQRDQAERNSYFVMGPNAPRETNFP